MFERTAPDEVRRNEQGLSFLRSRAESASTGRLRLIFAVIMKAMTNAELLEWVYRYLEMDEEIIVPVRRMWNALDAETRPALEEFTALVLADPRFEVMPGAEPGEDVEGMMPEEHAAYERELEELGLFSGPRLKLKSRQITLDHIARMIARHTARMERALQQARHSMPPQVSEEEEGQLIEIIEQVKALRRALHAAGLEHSEE